MQVVKRWIFHWFHFFRTPNRQCLTVSFTNQCARVILIVCILIALWSKGALTQVKNHGNRVQWNPVNMGQKGHAIVSTLSGCPYQAGVLRAGLHSWSDLLRTGATCRLPHQLLLWPCLFPAPARFSHFLLLNDFPPPSRSLQQAIPISLKVYCGKEGTIHLP